MPGRRHLRVGVHQAVAGRHVGRVAGYHVKRGRRKNPVGLPDVSPDNGNLILQSVQLYAAARHIRAGFTDLQAGKKCAFRPGLQQNGNHTGSRAQIQHALPALHAGKGRQQHRVHAEAEQPAVLDNPVPLPLQVIHPLPGAKQFFHQLSSRPDRPSSSSSASRSSSSSSSSGCGCSSLCSFARSFFRS